MGAHPRGTLMSVRTLHAETSHALRVVGCEGDLWLSRVKYPAHRAVQKAKVRGVTRSPSATRNAQCVRGLGMQWSDGHQRPTRMRTHPAQHCSTRSPDHVRTYSHVLCLIMWRHGEAESDYFAAFLIATSNQIRPGM